MTAREDLIGYALVALPNESALAKCEQLADAYRAEVLAEAADAMDAICEQHGVFGVGDRLHRMAASPDAVEDGAR